VEGVAGQRLNAQGSSEYVFRQAFEDSSQRLTKTNDNGFYERLGRWFLATPRSDRSHHSKHRETRAHDDDSSSTPRLRGPAFLLGFAILTLGTPDNETALTGNAFVDRPRRADALIGRFCCVD
jgi:hypothetical protein